MASPGAAGGDATPAPNGSESASVPATPGEITYRAPPSSSRRSRASEAGSRASSHGRGAAAAAAAVAGGATPPLTPAPYDGARGSDRRLDPATPISFDR